MRRIKLGSALCSFLVLFLSACGDTKVEQSAKTPSLTLSPKAGLSVVTIREGGENDPLADSRAVAGGTIKTWGGPSPKSLNMWTNLNSFAVKVCGLMFEPLAELHSVRDDYVGVLARHWEISEDKKTFTFQMDPEARWSDGTPVTAADVQFCYDVLVDEKSMTLPFRVSLLRLKRPEVLDEHTLKVEAAEVHWKNFDAACSLVAFPRHIWKDKNFNEINFDFPVVSGPYKISKNIKNKSLSMERRADWWGRSLRYNQYKYNFNELKFIFSENRFKVLEMLVKGDIDLYPIYQSQIWATQTDFESVQKNQVIRQEVYNREPKGFQGLAMNRKNPIFEDLRVRQAMALLLNRQFINEKLMYGMYFLLNSYYPTLYAEGLCPDREMTPYDPDRARALLEEAGWKVGDDGLRYKKMLIDDGAGNKKEMRIPFSVTILRFDKSGDPHLNVYTRDLKAAGIELKMEQLSYAEYGKRCDEQDFDLVWMAWGASRQPDPDQVWHSSTAFKTGTSNLTGVQDNLIDALIESQREEMSLVARNKILRKIDDRLATLTPYALLWNSAYHRLLYWNQFGTPKNVLGKYGDEDAALSYWWQDPAKVESLKSSRATGTPLPAVESKNHYQDP